MTTRRRGRRAWTPTFPEVDLGVCSTAAVRNLVGNFLEAATAQMVDGRLLANDRESCANPDVQDKRGQIYESKASCSSRWLCSAAQHDQLVEMDAWYALWDYRRPWSQGETPESADACRQGIAANVLACYVFPAVMLRDLIAETKHPEPVESNGKWGITGRGREYARAYYWVSRRCFRGIGWGSHRLQKRLLVHPRHRTGQSVRGAVLRDHVAYWCKYRDNVDRVPHPKKRGWYATEEDVALAHIALHELKTYRLRIGFVPADPTTGSHDQAKRSA